MRELSECELQSVSGGWDPYHNPLDPPRDVMDFSDETEAYIVVPAGSWVEDKDGNYIVPDESDDVSQTYFGPDKDKDGYVDHLEGGWVNYMLGSGEIIRRQIPKGTEPI